MKLQHGFIGMTRFVFGALILLCTGAPSQAYGPDKPTSLSPQQLPVKSGFRMPLAFEAVETKNGRRHFKGRGPGYDLLLTQKEAFFIYQEGSSPKPDRHQRSAVPESMPVRVISMQFLGAEAHPQLAAQGISKSFRNYYVGNKPKAWRTKVPLYEQVLYREVYPGIDLVFYEREKRLEYDFIVTPGADPKKILLAFQGIERLSLDEKNNLLIHTPGRDLVQQSPVIYQEIKGIKKQIPGRFELKGKNQVAFSVGDYDRSSNLVIDPHIVFCTYLGGGWVSPSDPPSFAADDKARGVALDGDGNVYVTGHEFSIDDHQSDLDHVFPATVLISGGSLNYRTPSAFLTKFSPTGEMIWSLIISGKHGDFGHAVAVDGSGNAYLAGATSSPEFPVTENGYQRSFASLSIPPSNAFVVKVDSEANLLYSTYLGGTGIDIAFGIAADDAGYAHVTGETSSNDFPTINAYMTDPDAGRPGENWDRLDAFVAKLDTNAATGADSLVFSTYLGGTRDDLGNSVAVDSSGNIYVAGSAHSREFPLVNAYTEMPGPCFTVFLSKFNPDGSELLYSTFLGPNYRTGKVSLAVEDSGNAYLAGTTASPIFPTRNARQVLGAGMTDVFVSRIDTNRIGEESLVYSTYLGGGDYDYAGGVAVQDPAHVYVVGTTYSTDFPQFGLFPLRDGGLADIFATYMNTEASGDASLTFSALIGGTDEDWAAGIAANESSVNVVGYTKSPNFPVTPEAFQAEHTNTDSYDAFVLRISEDLDFGLSAPSGPGIFFTPPGNYSVLGRSPRTSMPLGWGNTTSGLLNLQVALPKFQTPMTIYLTLFDGKNIDPNNLPDLARFEGHYFIGPKGEIYPPGSNPIPWVPTGPIDPGTLPVGQTHLDQLLSIDVSRMTALTGGQCYLALIALHSALSPHQNGNLGYYAWLTRFPVVQNQLKEVVQSLYALLENMEQSKKNPPISQAIRYLEASLTPEFWQDVWTPSGSGSRIFDKNQKAVQELLESGSQQPIVVEAINTIVQMARTLATNALVEALARGGVSRRLLQARKNMERAHQEMKSENLVQAILIFGKAWDAAGKALENVSALK